ncbi:Hypothetical predicted protein [Podarcis lilfordi]|uniref:DUF4219 domain-containing protein n=1 Tax=Podarcis lilfordi TaxID=74358 RepID=A0AA35LJG1_9SAUR|nr:Hypothetical predicted protein [Podarcis lilfordi]
MAELKQLITQLTKGNYSIWYVQMETRMGQELPFEVITEDCSMGDEDLAGWNVWREADQKARDLIVSSLLARNPTKKLQQTCQPSKPDTKQDAAAAVKNSAVQLLNVLPAAAVDFIAEGQEQFPLR